MDRRSNYLDVALALFLEHGFRGVSMDQVVAGAGGSKATLYRYFPSKQSLFEAIIDDVVATSWADYGVDLDAVTLADGLRHLGATTASGALDARTIALLRLALGEYNRFPELAHRLFALGPARNYSRLTDFLDRRQRAGEVAVPDLQVAAEQFLGGIVGHQQLRMALGVGTPTNAEIGARVEAAVVAFCRAYATAG